jgi:hypothetical protein
MKDYEKVNELERKVRWARHKRDSWESKLGHIKSEYKRVHAMHMQMDESLLAEVKETEETFNQTQEYFDNAVAELEAFEEELKKPKKPKKQENGKIKCDICGEEFTAQGYPNHHRKCVRVNELEKELEELHLEE